jgi:hypothetical protein
MIGLGKELGLGSVEQIVPVIRELLEKNRKFIDI